MLKSMTGFGKSRVENDQYIIQIEIRSLNSKQLDLNARLPHQLKEKEIELRNEIAKALERGKVDFYLHIEKKGAELDTELNEALLKSYFHRLKSLANELNQPQDQLMALALRMPDVLKNEKQELDESQFKLITEATKTAMEQLQKFRLKEGESLQTDFIERINKIQNCLDEIKKLEPLRKEQVRTRIKNNIEEVVGADKFDRNRFEQELIYYFEKLDINEEMVRLQTHLNYFKEVMKENNPGRKLNFITQEIGREINTIGSKANDAVLQKLVVLMKDELEKMKEQSLNVL